MAKKKADAKFLWSRESYRVQLLGGGHYVRIFDHEGRSHQVPARPGQIQGVLDAIYEDDPECAGRIAHQLLAGGIEHGWEEPQAEEAPGHSA